MVEGFHFLQPQWFWLLLPLLGLLWLLRGKHGGDSAWTRVCDRELLPYLLVQPAGRASRLPLWLLGTGWLCAVVALADPVWDRQPQPVFRSQDARVVVLDLSRSMLAADLTPSRLERARYKVADMLRRNREGQTGLVVFAGDAFVVAPLTSDTDTIQALLPPLDPGLMPVQGSRVDLALHQAGKLLGQAGLGRGEVLLVTDGFTDRAALEAAADLDAAGYRVSVLGVGTLKGAPLPDGSGGFVRDAQGEIVLPRLDPPALRELAAAGGGRYATIRSDTADIDRLLADSMPSPGTAVEQTERQTDLWQSRGPWLVLLLLPLAALVFRRGWLLLMLAMVGSGMTLPQPVMALGWDDLWLRADQQASRALQQGEPEQAAQLAQDPLLRGTAEYQAGAYEQAVNTFAQAPGPHAHYNQGNALARLGRYEEAIAAYDRALSEQPEMVDAEHNKALLEQLLEQQQQQEQQQQDQQQQQEQQQQDQQQQQEQQQQDQGQQQQQGQDAGQSEAQPGTKDHAGEHTEPPAADAEAQQDAGAEDEQPTADQQEDESDQTENAPVPSASPDESEAAGQRPREMATREASDSEEQQALEQWLRRIPDDPGGLLRRKFLYQYRQRAGETIGNDQQDW